MRIGLRVSLYAIWRIVYTGNKRLQLLPSLAWQEMNLAPHDSYAHTGQPNDVFAVAPELLNHWDTEETKAPIDLLFEALEDEKKAV